MNKNKLMKQIEELRKENKQLKKENKELKKQNTELHYQYLNLRKTQAKNKKRQQHSNKPEIKKICRYANTLKEDKNKINETQTIKSYISEELAVLGYNYTNVNFKSEYQLTKDNKNRVDLFYHVHEKKNFIVECKKANTDFNKTRGNDDNGETPTEQIRRYLKNTKETNIGILTDGLKMQIHLKSYPQKSKLLKKYYNIDLTCLSEKNLEMLNDLRSENLNVIEFAKKYGQ